jgi:hypothetical protein
MNLRTWSATLVVAAVLAMTMAAGSRVEAQAPGGAAIGGTRTFPARGGTVAIAPGYMPSTVTYATLYGPSPSTSSGISGYVPPYSYYAAIPPAPARIYVDYADSGFNFYGRPYGRPNDRWSWQAMGSNQHLLDRYYYPPVR